MKAATHITDPFFKKIEGAGGGPSISDSWQIFKTGMRAVAPDIRRDDAYLYYISLTPCG